MVHLFAVAATAMVVAAVPIEADRDEDRGVRFHHADHREFTFKSFSSFEVDDARFEIDGDEIVLIHLETPREEIRITADHRMYLDDEEITLDVDQRKTVEEFYALSFAVRSEAKAIAKEGLKIGVKGAKLGLHAVGCVFKMLLTSYDEKDLDVEMEAEADKIEAEAEKLEARAEVLEDQMERWEEVGRQMKDEIPALTGMDWL